MLSALVDSGYLFRNTDKTFVLGPTLLAIGRNAEQSFSAVDVARRELRRLADEFDVVAVAVFADKGQIVIRERAASRTHLGWAPPPGVSYPIYPWGVVFAAHLQGPQFETWLDQATPPLTPEQREEARERAAFVRAHGFVFAVHDPSRVEPVGDAPGSSRNPGRTITRLDPKAEYALHYIEAPVMNERGAAGFALALHNFSGAYTGEQVAAIAERLRESCRRVSTFVAGRHGPANFN